MNISDNSSGIWLNTIENVTIRQNTITNCSYAIYMEDSSNNSISDNDFIGNAFGLYINGSSFFNNIYHNSFLDNNNSAFDEGNNIWDDGYPSGGNYWSDYDEPAEGAFDADLDKIADDPYPIPGGNNQDRYPLVDIPDREDPIADAGPDQTVTEGLTVQFDGSGSTDNVAVVNWTWVFPGTSPPTLYGERPTYQFSSIGNYTITLTVTDAAGNTDTDTMWILVEEAIPIDDDGDGGFPVYVLCLLLLIILLIAAYWYLKQQQEQGKDDTEEEGNEKKEKEQSDEVEKEGEEEDRIANWQEEMTEKQQEEEEEEEDDLPDYGGGIIGP